jgi:hypothetical protein
MVLVQRKRVAALFVNRSTQQWIIRDPEGDFWTLPTGGASWEQREPFFPNEETELEPIPGHYKYMLDLPF